MKEKIIAWIKNYIYMRFFGGKEAKAKAKVKRQQDKVSALQAKQDIAYDNKLKAQEDLKKTIDDIQSREDF